MRRIPGASGLEPALFSKLLQFGTWSRWVQPSASHEKEVGLDRPDPGNFTRDARLGRAHPAPRNDRRAERTW